MKWLFEKGPASEGISFIEARKIVTAESKGRSAQGSRTAAPVVASRSGPTLPATHAFHTQTDLTWPKGQEEPSASLPLQAQRANRQLKPQRNFVQEGKTLLVHNLMENGSPLKVLLPKL